MEKTHAKPSRERPDMTVRKERPLNAETPLSLLRSSFVTPKDLFYVRNHGSVPEVDPESHRLVISGLVGRPLELSLEQIRREFPKREMTATLYCAGNRRGELMELSPMPGKVAWGAGAVGTASWAGVPLREVLQAARIGGKARHAAFAGLDRDEESGKDTHYGGSVKIEKAMSADVLLAYEMNGEPLTPEHGFPLRVVVGGYIGARSVKWLSEITLQESPSNNHYQTHEYKLFPPHVTAETADFSKGEMLGEIPLNAVICSPAKGETIAPGPVPVRGYAIAGGGRRVERVEVSQDGGQTWVEAKLTEDEGPPSAWRFWEAHLILDAGPTQIVVKATDSASCLQPQDVGEVWNFQGYANNAWHRLNAWVGG